MDSRSKIILQDGADIRQVMLRLALPWSLPRIEVHSELIPALVLQLAQHRIRQLAEACNCVLGEVLAGAMLVFGSFAVWATGDWIDLFLVLIVSVYAGLLGKGVSVVWTRSRLLLVLLRLRRQLMAGNPLHGSASAEQIVAQDDIYRGQVPPKVRYRTMDDCSGAAFDQRGYLRELPGVLQRPRVFLHDISDIDRLSLHVATRWRLPRIVIDLDGCPASTAQRAQHSLRSLSQPGNFLLGAILAMGALLCGGFYIIMTTARDWNWRMAEYWNWIDMAWLVMLVPCAGLIGIAIEVVWARVRILWILRQLRAQIGASESGS